jgi:hypothetical protein
MSRQQRGATIIEFALALIVFLTFLLGITDFGRMLFTWNAASEAARAAARYAVVCDNTSNRDEVLARMQALLPQITDVDLAWNPTGCSPDTCHGVTVTIPPDGIEYQWISPIAGLAALDAIAMPAFTTYLTREAMRGDPHSEDLCS